MATTMSARLMSRMMKGKYRACFMLKIGASAAERRALGDPIAQWVGVQTVEE
jgi:hypothetical protein